MKNCSTLATTLLLLLTASCATTWEEQFVADLTAISEPMLDTLRSVQDVPTAIEAKAELKLQLDQLDAHERQSQSTPRPPSDGPGAAVHGEVIALWALIIVEVDRINERGDLMGILRDTIRRVKQRRNWRYKAGT